MSSLPTCTQTGLPTVFAGGEIRRLGAIPGGPRLFKTFREAGVSAPDVPRSEWRPVNRRKQFKKRKNQRSHGSCNGFAGASALQKARVLRGLTLKELSGAHLYSQVNGGQDRGSLISEALVALKTNGVCLESQGPWDKIWESEYGPEERKTALRFRIEDAFAPEKFSELVSGIILGWIPVFAVRVGRNFDPDANGVCGYERGPINHAVHADGFDFVGGQPVLDMENSWDLWGDDGRGYITERHVDETGYQDCYLIKAAIEDPEEDNPAPVVG